MDFEAIRMVLGRGLVGIAGCGGLGSNCAVALARVGVGQLVVVDFDRVETSNLNRQYFFADQIGQYKALALKDNIARIDGRIGVEAHTLRVTRENVASLFGSCDVVVEAFDQAAEKEMLIETLLESWPDRPLVSGVGMAGWGNSDGIILRRYGNLYICGDGVTEVGPDTPCLAPRVGMVANMQANTVVELLLRNGKH